MHASTDLKKENKEDVNKSYKEYMNIYSFYKHWMFYERTFKKLITLAVTGRETG